MTTRLTTFVLMTGLLWSALIISFPQGANAGAILARPIYIGLEKGLVGDWSFNGNDVAGTVAYDRSGSGNHGTLTNGAARAVGRLGQAMELDGTNDYIAVSATHILSTNDWTLSAWIRPTTFTNGAAHHHVVQVGDDNGPGLSGPVLRYTLTTGLPQIIAVTGTNVETTLQSSQALSLAAWSHLVGVKKGTSLMLYVNGVLANETTLSSEAMDYTGETVVTRIGARADGAGLVQGTVDEARVYERALSADEIKRLYKIGATAKLGVTNDSGTLKDGLVGYWSFNGPDVVQSGSVLTSLDRSGQGNNATTSLASGATRVPGRLGQGLFFDEVDDYNGIGAPASLNLEQKTIAAWIKPESISGSASERIFSKEGSPEGFFWGVSPIPGLAGCTQASLIWHQQVSGTSDGRWCSDANTLTAGRWYHVAASYDRSDANNNDPVFYIDGVSVNVNEVITPNGSNVSDASISASIGAAFNGANKFHGVIDDVRVYNRILSADEIKRLYKNGATAKVGVTNNTGSLKDGLVGYWSFNGPDMAQSATVLTAYDRSGQGNNGTTSLSTGAHRAPGKLGQGLEFDGIDDVSQLGTPASLDLATKTIALWVKVESLDGASSERIINREGADEGFFFGVTPSAGTICNTGTLNFLWDQEADVGNDAVWCTGTSTVSVGSWQHVAVSYSRSSAANAPIFYINGEAAPHYTAAVAGGNVGNSDAAIQMHFGNDGNGGNAFHGVIDDLRIYNRFLTADEIKRLYNMGR